MSACRKKTARAAQYTRSAQTPGAASLFAVVFGEMERSMSAINLYRHDSLVQMEEYLSPSENSHELIDAIRHKWAFLREHAYAGATPIEILRTGGGKETRVVEIFRWNSQQARKDAERNERYLAIRQQIRALARGDVRIDHFTQIVRGFNANFPPFGGIELLKGVCSCLLNIDGLVKDFRMSVKNGVVLMHRSPGTDFDEDGRQEMYLKILMHGGEIIQGALGPIRVEQNFNMPNDGIVKSLGQGGNDFPAIALWRVAWRILTPIGALLTDPANPLIFGPAVVGHYPPVGTHFHSPTPPVALIHEETGARVGTLAPGELTAFDIVVTKDDEIYADILNQPPADIFEIYRFWEPKLAEHLKSKPHVPLEEQIFTATV
jgi:hypothetical protein